MEIWVLIAGLSLFLFGMKQIEAALKTLSGKKFKQFISNSTNHPIKSVATGIITTTIVQSSSLVGLVVLAFVGAGVIPLANAIAVVLGSNLGTTFTGWVVATLGFKVNLSTLVYPLLGIGGLGYALAKDKFKATSLFILGLGLLMLGLDFMKGSAQGFTNNLNVDILAGWPLIIYLLFGLVVTAVIQSSSAVMMLTLTALYANVLLLPEAAALVIGADLGTSSTVLLGSFRGSVAQKRLALAQVIFNLIVDTFAFISIHYILGFISLIQIQDPLLGLVTFHSLFNLLGLVCFIPFLPQYSKLMEKFITQRDDQTVLAQYIYSVPEDVTDAAVKALSLETRRLMSLVLILNLKVLRIDSDLLKENWLPLAFEKKSAEAFYLAIKELEGEIINYALKIQMAMNPTQQESDTLTGIAHPIDHYMKANRASIYAAKSLKDIRENLAAIDEIDNKTLTEIYHEIIKSAQKNYHELVGIMAFEGGLSNESIQRIREKSSQSHQYFRSQLHQHMSSQTIASFDLSTILNVNQEIFTSENALIDALTELFLAEHKHPD